MSKIHIAMIEPKRQNPHDIIPLRLRAIGRGIVCGYAPVTFSFPIRLSLKFNLKRPHTTLNYKAPGAYDACFMKDETIRIGGSKAVFFDVCAPKFRFLSKPT